MVSLTDYLLFLMPYCGAFSCAWSLMPGMKCLMSKYRGLIQGDLSKSRSRYQMIGIR